jgi:hypothetical protein
MKGRFSGAKELGFPLLDQIIPSCNIKPNLGGTIPEPIPVIALN